MALARYDACCYRTEAQALLKRWFHLTTRFILYSLLAAVRPVLSPFLRNLLEPICVKYHDDANPDALKILFIGNSLTFTHELPLVLSNFLLSRKEPGPTGVSASNGLKIYMVVQGGFRLQDHWKFKAARKMLKEHKWDYVVLQEQSMNAAMDRAKLFQYADHFGNDIRAQGAKIVVFCAWSYKHDAPSYKAATKNLTELVEHLKAIAVPVGECWNRLQSEHPEIELYEDAVHPSQAGTYLSACAFYSTLTGLSPLGLPFQMRNLQDEPLIELDERTARFAQEVAQAVTLDRATPETDFNEH